MAAGAISGLHARLIIPSSKARKHTKNDNDGFPPDRYYRAECVARRLSPHWKSSAVYLCTLQDITQRYVVSMNKCEKM